MTFLVPAMLAAGLAIAIPIIVHLTRKRKTKVLRFPSLRFLEKVPYKAESRRRIHHWFLLSLRALAILLIALAFSRPFVDRSAEAAAAGSGPTERVILLDRSWSMGVGDRFAEAQDAAREAIGNLGPLDRVSLVVFAGGASAATRSQSDPARVRSAIDSTALVDEATRYGPALKLAQTILEESELPGRELVIVSDFQRTGWTGEEGVRLPAGTFVRTLPIGGEVPANVSIAGVRLVRERVEERERVTPTARLTRTGSDEPAEVAVVLTVDEQVLQRQTVSFAGSGAETVTFDPVTVSTSQTQGEVRIDWEGTPEGEDALRQDDAARFVLSPGRATTVRVLTTPRGQGSDDLYLNSALEISQGGNFEVIPSAGAAPSADLLDETEVLILVNRAYPAGAEAERIRSWVAAGGGLILIAGEGGRWGEAGQEVFPGAMGGVLDRDGRGERIASVSYEHPIFELFQGPRQGDFSAARFYRARNLDVAESDSVEVIARFDDGSVALVERRVGDGRVLVWTSTVDATWTDLALQPVFLPFVHQLVGYASGRSETLESFTAGQVIDVTDGRAMESAGLGAIAEAISASEERVVMTPSGASTDLSEGPDSHFLELREAGFYEIRPPGRDDLRPISIAVNVDGAESDLTVLDPEEMAAAIQGGSDGAVLSAVDEARAQELRRNDQERRQSWWRWLLAAAFGILVLETILSNRLSRGTGRSGGHARATG